MIVCQCGYLILLRRVQMIQSVIRTLLERTKNAIRGYFLWLKVGWPFAVLTCVVLAAVLLTIEQWIHVWVVLILGTVFTVLEMLNYAVERLCNLCAGTKYNNEVRIIKDVCAGTILVSGLALGAVALWVVLT
jgi:diacylglycerol kinase